MTRPEVSFEVYQISTTVKNATVADILAVNKVIKFVNFLGIKLIFQRNLYDSKGLQKTMKMWEKKLNKPYKSIYHWKAYKKCVMMVLVIKTMIIKTCQKYIC